MPVTIDLSKTYRGADQLHKFASLVMKGVLVTPDTTAVYKTKEDATGLMEAYGETLPTDAEAGFKVGCEFTLIGGDAGSWPVYINIGDETSCQFINSSPTATEQEIRFYNDSGAPITDGTLISVGGWNFANAAWTAVKADKNTDAAEYVVDGDVADASFGVAKQRLVLLNQNTSGRTEDDPVYLSDTGAYTFTSPTGSDDLIQIVGRVARVHATTGQIQMDVTGSPDKIGSNQLQDQAVNANKLHNDARMNYLALRAREALPAPSGANQLNNRFRFMQAPCNMELVAVRIIPSASTSGSDVNNRYEFNVVNVTQAANLMSAASVTDGNELAANTARELVMNQNTASIQNNDVLAVNVDIKDDGSAGPTDLSAATFDIEVEWRLRA